MKLVRVSPSLKGPQAVPDQVRQALTLSLKTPKGAAADMSGKRAPLLTAGLPYALKFAASSVALEADHDTTIKASIKDLRQRTSQVLKAPDRYNLYIVTQGGGVAFGKCNNEGGGLPACRQCAYCIMSRCS